MLTKQQCALLKAQAKQQVGERILSNKPKEVEVEVTMQSAFKQFSLIIYKQHKE
jgi:hypothetical protein